MRFKKGDILYRYESRYVRVLGMREYIEDDLIYKQYLPILT